MKALTESGKSITILDKYEIKRGGEGKILTIPELPNQVAKIYLNSNYQHMSKAQKDALTVLDDRHFVKPQELIFKGKKKKDILGFTMEYLSQDFFPLAAFFNKNFCNTHQIDNTFKYNISQILIDCITEAHQKKIIIGDLSGLNILVNLQGTVKFIDVDAYETPVHSHWGLLLDEIRDYLYQGLVSQKSDYFALAVIIFNLFTHLHPFKGIHKQYRSLAERMIQKIPVFKSDSQLITPKCYVPLKNSDLQKQFERIFAKGERFLLSLTSQVSQKPTILKSVVTPTSGDLITKEVYHLNTGEFFQRAFFTQNLGVVFTNQQILLYDCSNKGYLTSIEALSDAAISEVFVGVKNILFVQKQDLFLYQKGNPPQKIQNLNHTFEKGTYFQIDNILVLVEDNYLRYLFLDEIIQGNIRVEQTPAFGKAFDVFNGLIQNVGGIQYVFYHSGKTLSSIKSDVLLKSVSIQGQTGIATYEEKKQGETSLKYEYFFINNLQMKRSHVFLSKPISFSYRMQNESQGLIFEPDDNQLLIRQSTDFQVIQTMKCDLLSTDSQLFNTPAGIVALEKDFCYLLNSK